MEVIAQKLEDIAGTLRTLEAAWTDDTALRVIVTSHDLCPFDYHDNSRRV